MSNPSFSNIDLWLFEYSEGNLSPEQIAQLESFMMNHPEFQIDKDMWDASYVASESVVFPNQKSLERKRPVTFYWIASTAASLLLIGGYFSYTYLGFEIQENPIENQIATQTTVENGVKKFKNKSSNFKNKATHKTTNKLKNLDQFTFLNLTGSISPFEYLENPGAFKMSFFKNDSKIYNYCDDGELRYDLNMKTPQLAQKAVANNELMLPDFYLNENQTYSKENNAKSNRLNIGKLKSKGFSLNQIKAAFFEAKKKETDATTWKLKRTSAKNTKKSFSLSSKLRAIHRKIEKMIDNPIALKNLKDPYYHVPGMQSVDVNFGATGTLLATRVQTTSRYQWMGNSNEQLTNQVLIDGYSYAMRGGVGIQINQSNYHNNGVQNTFAAVTYSPKFSVSKNVTVEPAIRFKMGNRRIDESVFKVGQLIEVDRQNIEQFYSLGETPKGKSLWYKDVGASVMVNTKWFFTGIQVDNIARHQTNVFGSNSTQRAPLHTVFTLGTDYQSKNKKFGFSPYFIYQKHGSLSEAWLGANYRVNWFTVGAGISSNAEPAASIGLKFKHVAINYNADLTHSQLFHKNILSHQISLRFLTNPSRFGKRLLTL